MTSGQGRLSHMSGMMEGEISGKQPTSFKPFNLTKPKPKTIPQPDALPREVVA